MAVRRRILPRAQARDDCMYFCNACDDNHAGYEDCPHRLRECSACKRIGYCECYRKKVNMAKTEKEMVSATQTAIMAVDNAIRALDLLFLLDNEREATGFDTALLATAYGNLHALKASILLEVNRCNR